MLTLLRIFLPRFVFSMYELRVSCFCCLVDSTQLHFLWCHSMAFPPPFMSFYLWGYGLLIWLFPQHNIGYHPLSEYSRDPVKTLAHKHLYLLRVSRGSVPRLAKKSGFHIHVNFVRWEMEYEFQIGFKQPNVCRAFCTRLSMSPPDPLFLEIILPNGWHFYLVISFDKNKTIQIFLSMIIRKNYLITSGWFSNSSCTEI